MYLIFSFLHVIDQLVVEGVLRVLGLANEDLFQTHFFFSMFFP